MTDPKIIWDFLMKEIGNPYGVAGLLGNLYAESSLEELQITPATKFKIGDYYLIIKSGEYEREAFAHDGIAFGFAQWRYWSRKAALWDFCQPNPTNLYEHEYQLGYLIKEIKTYKTVWKTLLNATSVKEASDIVMMRYEKPSNTSNAAKEKRAGYGQKYFDLFADAKKEEPEVTWAKQVKTTTKNVNIRTGNDKSYGKLTRVNEPGTVLNVISKAENGWYAVEITNTPTRWVGWIDGAYIEEC